MASENIISPNFWKGLVTVATIVAGVFYIEKSMKDTIKESMITMEYRVNLIEKTIESQSKLLTELTLNVASCTYRVNTHQDLLKEMLEKSFVKPEEPKIQDK